MHDAWLTPLIQAAFMFPNFRSADFQETGGGLTGCIEYATAQFSRAAVERMAEHFIVLAHSIVQNPSETISRLNMMSPDERRQLLVDWNKH